ncbi:hypothetical protein D3C87_1367430 [compost metagenome]
MTPTFCTDCEFVVAESRKRSPSGWLCLKHKRLEGQGFVDPKFWSNEEPYLRCKDVNAGACPLFEKRRENENG